MGTELKLKATAEGYADFTEDYQVKDELTEGENSMDIILTKNKVMH